MQAHTTTDASRLSMGKSISPEESAGIVSMGIQSKSEGLDTSCPVKRPMKTIGASATPPLVENALLVASTSSSEMNGHVTTPKEFLKKIALQMDSPLSSDALPVSISRAAHYSEASPLIPNSDCSEPSALRSISGSSDESEFSSSNNSCIQEQSKSTTHDVMNAPFHAPGEVAQRKRHVRSCGDKVLQIAEWKFPPEVADKASYIQDQIRRNNDVQYVDISHAAPTPKRRRKRPRRESTTGQLVFRDVCFDPDAVQYDETPYGFLDQFVFTLPSTDIRRDHSSIAGKHLVHLPDPKPEDWRKESRRGPQYQARIPRQLQDFRDKRGTSRPPGYDMLWDPVRAEAAEKRGENIEDFLGGNLQLADREFRMSILHWVDYDVASAQKMLATYSMNDHRPWTRTDGLRMDYLLRNAGDEDKDFEALAAKVGRAPWECMVHYYNWKERCRSDYRKKKTQWRKKAKDNDYCCVCNDGGDLLVLCDCCDDAYHLDCVNPPLQMLPFGDWFCPPCEAVKDERVWVQVCRSPLSPSRARWLPHK